MPEYLTPGVYIQEFEIGARPIEGVSTSTTGFLGLTERGPTIPPRLVTSWDEFLRIYGSYIDGSNLAYAVEGFFNNGGQRCYIGRVAKDGDTAFFNLNSENPPLTCKAVGKGLWGNRVGIRIEKSSTEPDNKEKFKMTLAYWSEKKLPSADKLKVSDKTKRVKELNDLLNSASHVEFYDNLTSNDANPADYYLKKFGDPLNDLSNLIILEGKGIPKYTAEDKHFDLLDKGSDEQTSQPPQPGQPPEKHPINFEGESDDKIGKKGGLGGFGEIDEISLMNVPDILQAGDPADLIDKVLDQCENLKDRFAIIDARPGLSNPDQILITSEARPSKYGAIYYPWIKVYDPVTQALKTIPPGGYIAGIYARSDAERGVHKAPANEIVRGARELEFTITDGDQGILNPRGINAVRSFKERGILVWGARTSIIDPLWKYVNVRRLFIYIEESIEKGTQWVVFEPNDEKLWARVKATITQFLTGVWKDGALMGTKPEEAFFVKCDRSTMTQDDIDNGRLICVIGIAPVKPAEFVIFKIAQWQGGSAATE